MTATHPSTSAGASPEDSRPTPPSDFYAVIPAGGGGTRLWPLSRAHKPKFLFDLVGDGRSLLQATVDRLEPLVPDPSHVVVVTGAAHLSAVREQLPQVPEESLLPEPAPRDSMAAIGLAAAVLQHRHGEVIIGSFAADHIIRGAQEFTRSVEEGIAAARAGFVVTIGIAASRPSVAFGYIHSGTPLSIEGAPSARLVQGFTEKPDAETARDYLATGEYRWNAGMFIASTTVLLERLREQRPDLYEGLIRIAEAWDTPERGAVAGRIWPGLEKIAIDHAIAEPIADEGGVATVPGSFGWDDVGDFNSLAALLPTFDGSKVLGDTSLLVQEDVAGSVVVPAGGRVVALLGVDDLVVVDTPDAVLVTTRSRAQQVKRMVARVREQGFDELL